MFNPDGSLMKTSGRWAISKAGIDLIERTPVARESDASEALRHLGIGLTSGNLDLFFPRNRVGKRCPTFEFMQRWHVYRHVSREGWSSNV